MFMGFLVPVLVFLTILNRAPRRSTDQKPEVFPYLLLTGFGVALACGPNLPGVPLEYSPWQLLSELPAMGGMRVPARSVLLSIFAVSVLFGRAVWIISERWCSRRVKGLVVTAIIAVVLLENYPLPKTAPAICPSPTAYAWLEKLPDSVAVAEYPSFYGSDLWSFSADYMMHAAQHNHPVANGYSRYVPEGFERISGAINRLPDQSAVDILKSHGINFVIVHPQMCFKHEMQQLFGSIASSSNPIEQFNTVIKWSNNHYSDLVSVEGMLAEIKFTTSRNMSLIGVFQRDLVFYLDEAQY